MHVLSTTSPLDRLVGWDLMALSAQIGYIMPGQRDKQTDRQTDRRQLSMVNAPTLSEQGMNKALKLKKQ